jgi:hypothetical protein
MLVGWENLLIICQGSPKYSGRVFEALWQLSPSQLSLFSSTRTFPLEGKDGLALWGQVDATKCVLKVQTDKKLCLSWDKAQKACMDLVPQGVKWHLLSWLHGGSLSRCFWIPVWTLWGMYYCLWLIAIAPGFNSTTTGGMFQASPGVVLSPYSWNLKGKLKNLFLSFFFLSAFILKYCYISFSFRL